MAGVCYSCEEAEKWGLGEEVLHTQKILAMLSLLGPGKGTGRGWKTMSGCYLPDHTYQQLFNCCVVQSDNPSFDNLPHDVLVIIADHANSPKDLRLVSKEFCAAVGEAAVSLKPSQDLQASQLLAVSSAFLKATALDVSHWHSLTSTIFLNLKILFPDLIELHLPGSCLSEAGPGLFSAFPQLRKLVLSDPHGMMGDQLPSCICKVWTSSLQCLHLQECSQLEELTLEINRLKNLRELCISDCHGLLALRQGAGGLTSLHTLSVVRCFSLREFSDSVWGMTSLQRLCVDDCPLLDLPETVSGLVGLRDLEVQNCSQISSLPEEVADLALLQVLQANLSILSAVCSFLRGVGLCVYVRACICQSFAKF